MCQSLFFDKVAGLFLRTPLLQNTSGRLLLFLKNSPFKTFVSVMTLNIWSWLRLSVEYHWSLKIFKVRYFLSQAGISIWDIGKLLIYNLVTKLSLQKYCHLVSPYNLNIIKRKLFIGKNICLERKLFRIKHILHN